MLLTQLSAYGIVRDWLSSISSFLSNQIPAVYIHKAPSFPKPVTSSVKHGSVLCPLQFTVSANYIIKTFPHGKPLIHADALMTAYHFKQSQLSIYEVIINSSMDSISTFSRKWLLDRTPKKCFYLPIGKFPHLTISLCTRTVSWKRAMRLLYSSTLSVFQMFGSKCFQCSLAYWFEKSKFSLLGWSVIFLNFTFFSTTVYGSLTN